MSKAILRTLTITIFFSAFAQAQSSYDPATIQTFGQATAGMALVKSYTFGTNSGNNITNLTQLGTDFQSFENSGTAPATQEWEVYQPFNTSNFVFGPTSLNLTATIPSNGGLYQGGIHSGQLWSKQFYQPAKTGYNVYAMTARMKIPGATGTWPAFWLACTQSSDNSEVDIAEFQVMTWENQFDWTGFDHGPGYGEIFYELLTTPWVWHPGYDFSTAFHDYQLIWTPDATYKYVDGQLVKAQQFTWTASSPSQVSFNLAVGSSSSIMPGLIPNSLAEFPTALQIESLTILGGSSAASIAASPSGSVTYSGIDTATQGAWSGKYGGDGYVIANWANKIPAYATLSVAGDLPYTWSALNTDVRALQWTPGSSNRVASLYNSPLGEFFKVSVSDGKTHQVALYLLDWDNSGRAETITVRDANTNGILAKQSYSGFQKGQYALWNVTGDVIFEVTSTNSATAAVSAIFFGTAAPVVSGGSTTAQFGGTDTGTEGIWGGRYGKDGFQIANDSSSRLPGYVALSFSNASTYTWDNSTTDPRALETSNGSGSRIASTYYDGSGASFSINLNLTDGQPHRVALYLLDWSNNGRSETISISDASSNAILSTQSFTNFDSGKYAYWTLKGDVVINVTVTSTGSLNNPIVSGIFFDSSTASTATTSTASYAGLDKSTQGSWTGHYGADGFQIANDSGSALPAYAGLSFSGASTYTWDSSTSDPRALQSARGSSGRMASTYFNGGVASFSINLNLTDSNVHRVALYLLDWTDNSRNETISIADAASRAVLSTQSFSDFNSGQYAVWNIKGDVVITVTCTSTAAGDNPLVSGIFFN